MTCFRSLTRSLQVRRRVSRKPQVVVALPANDEEDRIGGCLEALDNQVAGRADHVLLLANNCSDRTACVARELRSRLTFELHVVEVQLPPDLANAGYARHLALEEAADLAGSGGILLTTDADGRVDADWIGANLAAIQAGADAVAGWAELDPVDWGFIPLRLHEDDAKECAYDAACDELHALLDPNPADPLPRHTQASGASIAVTAAAYRAAGGMPTVPSGEDRAFIAALRRIDARIRHAPECRVVVSGRIDGRATGGMADTIRRRLKAPDPYLDDRLEPAEACASRASLRWLARSVYEFAGHRGDWWEPFALTEEAARVSLDHPTFGRAWERLEMLSPPLLRQRVSSADLPKQQSAADELLQHARRDAHECRRRLLRAAITA